MRSTSTLRKFTREQFAVIERQAELLAEIRPQKELAHELGCTQSYLSQVLRRLVNERLGKVPRVTRKYSLDRNSDIGAIPSENERDIIRETREST